jgi:hypothetical protein
VLKQCTHTRSPTTERGRVTSIKLALLCIPDERAKTEQRNSVAAVVRCADHLKMTTLGLLLLVKREINGALTSQSMIERLAADLSSNAELAELANG